MGPSHLPSGFPVQSWSSANAIGRTAFAISPTSTAECGAAHHAGGCEEDVDDVGESRLVVRASSQDEQRFLAGNASPPGERVVPARRRRRAVGGQVELPPPRRREG